MNIKNKDIIFVFGIFVFVVAGILFLSAENHLPEITGISSTDFSYYGEGDYEIIQDEIVCKSGDCTFEILGEGGEKITIEATEGIKVSPLGKISVTKPGAEFSINGNKFSNIDSGEIVLDQETGEIKEAKFFTDPNGGTYDINGNKFEVLGDKEFIYPAKKGGFELPDGTKVLELQKNIRIETLENEFIKYQGNDIGGVLNFDEEGNAFVNLNNKAIINGVSIENKGRSPAPNLPVFFDKATAEASGKTEYVVTDLSKNFFAFKEAGGVLPRTIRIEFNKDNYLFGDLMDEKDYLFVGEGGVDPGYLEIIMQGENLPVVKTQGHIELNPNEKRFQFEGENIIFRTGTNAWPIPEDRSMISGTVPMVFESQDRKVVGLIPENQDKHFYWTSRGGEVAYGPIKPGFAEQLGVKLPDLITKSWIENSEIKYDRMETISFLANDPSMQKYFEDSLSGSKHLKTIYEKELKEEWQKLISASGAQEDIEDLTKEYLEGKKSFEEYSKGITSIEKHAGEEKPIAFTRKDLEEKIGKPNTDLLFEELKNKAKLNYVIYSEISKKEDLDISFLKAEEELEKIFSPTEIDKLDKCTGGDAKKFDSCFFKSYDRLGPRTIECIINPDFCSEWNFNKVNKMRTG